MQIEASTDKQTRSSACTHPKPRALSEALLDRRTHEWRRRAELVTMFTGALGGAGKIDDILSAKIAAAADLRLIAELTRTRFLKGEHVTLTDVTRCERVAATAEKALGLSDKEPSAIAGTKHYPET